jgi:hypothetical protein
MALGTQLTVVLHAVCVIHTLDKRPTTIIKDKLIFSSERMLHKDYESKSSVEKIGACFKMD